MLVHGLWFFFFLFCVSQIDHSTMSLSTVADQTVLLRVNISKKCLDGSFFSSASGHACYKYAKYDLRNIFVVTVVRVDKITTSKPDYLNLLKGTIWILVNISMLA